MIQQQKCCDDCGKMFDANTMTEHVEEEGHTSLLCPNCNDIMNGANNE